MARGEDTGNHPGRKVGGGRTGGPYDPVWHGPPVVNLSPEEHAAHREAMSKAATSGDLNALLMAHAAKIQALQPTQPGFSPEQEAGLRQGIGDLIKRGGGETWGHAPMLPANKRKGEGGEGDVGRLKYGRVR